MLGAYVGGQIKGVNIFDFRSGGKTQTDNIPSGTTTHDEVATSKIEKYHYSNIRDHNAGLIEGSGVRIGDISSTDRAAVISAISSISAQDNRLQLTFDQRIQLVQGGVTLVEVGAVMAGTGLVAGATMLVAPEPILTKVAGIITMIVVGGAGVATMAIGFTAISESLGFTHKYIAPW